MTAAPPALSQPVGGRYRLVERLGSGGMGEVWRADDTLLGRPVALKALRAEHAASPEFLARFRGEARCAGRLQHPGIASVLDYGENDGAPWIVLELVEGEPLSAILRREGPLAPELTLDVVAQAAWALHAAHLGGVVHRDVKPGNLLVRPDGRVKVTDFGVATTSERDAGDPLTETGTLLGTVGYLSPEQAAGSPATPASDVYALGVVAYECLAGHRPFSGDNPVSVALMHLRDDPPPLPARVPAEVADLVRATLSKDPADRPASAAELAAQAAALRERLLAGDGDLPRSPVQQPPVVPGAPHDPQTRAMPVVDASAADTLATSGVAAAAAPATAEDGAAPQSQRPGSGPAKDPGPLHRRWLPLLLALAVVAVVSAAALGVRAALAPTVVVPELAGVPAAQAVDAVERLGLRPERRDLPTDAVPAGHVVGSEPHADATVEPGSAVTLLVSSGPPPVHVDPAALVGRPEAEVVAELTALGLAPVVAADGTGTPPGTVSGVTPSGPVPVGSSVTVSVVPPPPPPPPPAAAPPAAPAPTSASAPGRGKGKGGPPAGKGKGKGKS